MRNKEFEEIMTIFGKGAAALGGGFAIIVILDWIGWLPPPPF